MRIFRSMRSLWLLALLVVAGGATLAVSAASVPWYRCPVTQNYGHNLEHGVDLATNGRTITALLAGTITFDKTERWDGEVVQDITWSIKYPWLAKGFHYAYVQILAGSSYVHVGQKIGVGTPLGRSGTFIEFGLTRSSAYGVRGNWWTDWTTDPRFLL